MNEYVLIFRMDITTPDAQPSAEQMQKYMLHWMDWIQQIEDAGQLASGGNHFHPAGKVLRKGNNITDGPYTVDKESIAGYIVILARDMDDAVFIARNCPVLNGAGTSVEIRETARPGV